jgi:alpha-D-ribose 1-methylphosphonate 5-phosphate C-P lyase
MVENEQNANLLRLEYKPKENEYKSNDLTEEEILLQQVPFPEYLQQMDMYQKDQKQNFVEDQ